MSHFYAHSASHTSSSDIHALMPKSVRQVQAKMGQFGYILVHGYLPLKIYPNVYIPRKHNHRTYVHYVESYSVSKVSLNNI